MHYNFKKLCAAFVLPVLVGIGATGCKNDVVANENVERIEPKAVAQAKPLVPAPTAKKPKPEYDFMRQLRLCDGANCSLLDEQKMMMSDYNADLIASLNLSTSDTFATARQKIKLFYTGMVSSGMGTTTEPSLQLLTAQLSPGRQKLLPEYDIVVRTEGAGNGASVRDWGARIRCAPVKPDTQWQTSPC